MDRNTMLASTNPATAGDNAESERRLWTAVLTLAVEDWRRGSLRKRREAERFLFEEGKDFQQVCSAAGIEPSDFRARLLKIGRRLDAQAPFKGAALA